MLGIARMHVAALERNFGRSGVEVLKLQFAYLTTVHRVSPVATELLHIELMGTEAYFLVRIEADAYLSMLDFRVFLQIDNG